MGYWGDVFDTFEGVGALEVANLSLDELEMEKIPFSYGKDDMEN